MKDETVSISPAETLEINENIRLFWLGTFIVKNKFVKINSIFIT